MANRIDKDVFSKVKNPFKLLAQASHEALLIHSGGKMVLANDHFCTLFGYKQEELMGKSIMILTPESYQEMLLERIEKDETGTFPGIGLRKDGTTIVGEIHVSSVETDEGNFRVLSIRDLTEQVRTQKALKENEDRLRLALSASDLGTFDWFPSIGDLFWDERMHEMFQLDLQDHRDRNDYFFSVVHPEDKEDVFGIFSHVLKPDSTEREFENDYRIVLAGNQVRYIYTKGLIFRSPTGEVERIIGTCRDDSKQKYTQTELEESEKILSLIYNNTQEFMALIKVENRDSFKLASVNQRVLELSQHLGEDISSIKIEGMPLELFLVDYLKFYPETASNVINRCRQILETKQHINDDIDHVFSNGEKLSVSISLIPIFNDEEACSHILYSCRDITELKQARDQVLSVVIETEDRERKRIAKEIHDSLGQNLTTAFLNLKRVKKHADLFPPEVFEGYSAGLNNLDQAIEESRSIAYNLMPKAIDDFGYVLAVESMFVNIRSAMDLDVTFYNNLKGERLEKKMEISLYRITQEAVTNVIKHAQAKTLAVQLMKYSDQITLMIEDDGVGFSPEEGDVSLHSMGLKNMKTRAQALSGSLTIDSTNGKGSVIMVELPIQS